MHDYSSSKQAERDLNALKSLTKSRGWALLMEVIDHEANQVLHKMANPQPLNTEDIHYLRGVLFSALEVRKIPERLTLQIEGAYALAFAKEKEQEK